VLRPEFHSHGGYLDFFPPKNLSAPVLPPFGAAAAGDAAPLSSSPSPSTGPKKLPDASPPPSGEVAAADAAGTGSALTGDAPPRPQGVRPFASPAAIDSNDELMMEVMQEDETEAAAHLQRWNMGFAVLL
jgi:hypothetical protein